MKQTAVTVMYYIAYIIEWRKANGNQKIIGARDIFAHDTKFITFLRACFKWNERDNGSTCIWLDTPRPEPLTEAEELEFIKPLAELQQWELEDLCRFAEVTPENVKSFIANINIEKGE